MNSAGTKDVLNQLVALHHRSLASYLSYASPTWNRGDEQGKETLSLITAQQKEMVDRLGELIMENDGVVTYGEYPMVYTGWHDLSFDFLLDKLIEHQTRAVATIEDCVAKLPRDPEGRELAMEALGLAKGHLDSLRELKAA